MFTNQEQESIHGLSNPRHSIIPKDPGAIVTVKQADLASPILAPDNSAILPLVRDTTSILPVLHRPDVRAPWNQRMAAQPLEAAHILATYGPAKKRLLLFDYDGTLTPIVEDPAKAILSDEAIRSIQTLTSDPRNDVWVISGRSQTFLEQCLGNVSGLGLVAEHGAFVRYPEANIWEDLAQKADMSWQEDVVKIFQSYVDLTPGSRIEKKRVAVVWHFRQANQDFAALQAAECKKQLEGTVAGKYPLDIVNGKCVLEARPTFVNKGQIAQRLIDDIRHSTGKAPNFVLCIGDDATDEGISTM